jgi:hypothetical protein
MKELVILVIFIIIAAIIIAILYAKMILIWRDVMIRRVKKIIEEKQRIDELKKIMK